MQISILTSNDYLNILPGFAYLFNKFYPNQKATVVRYDVRPPKLPENFNTFAIGKQSDYTWAGGLQHYINTVEDEFILLLLEDYYLSKPVNAAHIEALIELMQSNPKIAKIDLSDDRLNHDHTFYMDLIVNSNPVVLIKSNNDAPYLASVQAAIWRVDFLKAILNKDDNAWQFEKTKKAKTYLNKHKSFILGSPNRLMTYVNAVGGEGTKPGQYDLKKFPKWMIDELNKKAGIKVG